MHHLSLLLALLVALLASAANAQQDVQQRDAAPTTYTNCGLTSSTKYSMMDRKVANNNPVFFPPTEAALKKIAKQASARGCKLRVRGSGHTSNGLVAQTNETNVVIVHLGKLKSSAWKDAIDPQSCVATIGAGKSFIDLMQLARPAGCVMETQTTYPAFSIGGVIANQVAGNGIASGMLYDYVTGVRVLLASGEIKTFTKEEDLRFFRGAYGLTGVILQVKYRLVKDFRHEMVAQTYEYDFYNELQQSLMQFATDQAIAQATHRGIQCFFNVYPSAVTRKQYVNCFMTKFNSTTDRFPNAKSKADKKTQQVLRAAYKQEKKKWPNLSYTGGKLMFGLKPCDILPEPYCLDKFVVNYGFAESAAGQLNLSWKSSRDVSTGGMNDGFMRTSEMLEYEALSMYIPEEMLLPALGAYLQITGQLFTQVGSAIWLPNAGFEWRPVTPNGKSAFDLLEAGKRYYQVEIVSMVVAKTTPTGFAIVCQQLQQAFAALGGIPHPAKHYNYNNAGQPFATPYTFYTQAQVDAVNAKLDEIDPKRIFSAGSALFDFAPSEFVPYSQA